MARKRFAGDQCIIKLREAIDIKPRELCTLLK